MKEDQEVAEEDPLTAPRRSIGSADSEDTGAGDTAEAETVTAVLDVASETNAPPLVSASNLSIAGKSKPVLAPLSFELAADRAAAFVAASGSGRSSLLLAIAGRMRGVSGTLTVAGTNAITSPRETRKLVSVARVGTYIDVEHQLTVEDCIIERTLMEGADPRSRYARFYEVTALFDVSVAPSSLVAELDPFTVAVTTLALACIRPAKVVVFDDVERDLSVAEQIRFLRGASDLAQAGTLPIFTTREKTAAASAEVTVIAMSKEGTHV